MGLGGTVAVLPGVSCMGAATSVGSMLGMERSFGLNMALLMNMAYTVGLIVFDFIAIFSAGLGTISFMILLCYLLAAAAAFVGVTLAIRLMRAIAANLSFTGFAYYCWGAALFAFILYLAA